MSAFRLSPLRGKGWFRLGVLGAVAMIPLTVMQHALGYFSAGEAAIPQAAEYLAAGAILWLAAGAMAAWVARGFAVRVKEDDEQDEPKRPSLSAPHRPSDPKALDHKPADHKPAH